MPTAPKRGEVWSADLGQGTEQTVIILQNEAAEVIATTIVVPLKARSADADLATNVFIPADEQAGIPEPHVAICPQL